MKMNWKVRVKNPVFWLTMVPALIALVYEGLRLFNVTLPFPATEAERYAGLIISALTTVGVLVDPTTAGLTDSERALVYETPADSNEQWYTEG